MIYVIILSVWMSISWLVAVLTKCNDPFKEVNYKIGAAIGTTLRYTIWAWLIYKIVLIY